MSSIPVEVGDFKRSRVGPGRYTPNYANVINVGDYGNNSSPMYSDAIDGIITFLLY